MRCLRGIAPLLLAAACAASAQAAPLPAAPPDCLRLVRGVDLQSATIPQLGRAMARRRLTSLALTRAYLRRIAAYDEAGPKLNAIRVLAADALAQARARDRERRAGRVRGPLHGIPILLKDNIGTADMPTTAGSIALEGSVPQRDAFVTARLRAAGAIVLGKAELSEWAGWVSLSAPPGWSSLGGQVVNAYTGGDPSGSSAGSGVASSIAFAGAALGSETSGSILSPSLASSLVGIKPTRGMTSRAGVIPLAEGYDVVGPMARNVTDAAIVLGAIAGADPRDPATAEAGSHQPAGGDWQALLRPGALKGATIAFVPEQRDGLDEGRRADFDAALDALRRLGAQIAETQTLGTTLNAGIAEIAAIPNDFKASLNRYLAEETKPGTRVRTLSDVVAFNAEHPDKFPYGQQLLQASDATPGVAALATVQNAATRVAAQAAIEAALAETGADAVVTPGNSLANIGAAAGYPSVIVPDGYGESARVPDGLAFLGRAFDEQQLVRFAYDFEQATRKRLAPEDVSPAMRRHAARACA